MSVRYSALVAAAAGLLCPELWSQERVFTKSRDWYLPYPGEHELELKSFFDTTHGDWVAKIEYEYGATSHFAVEPGLEVAENEDGDTEIEGADLELRFNFGEFRQHSWLPAISLEYEYPFEDEEASNLEIRSGLSRYGERDTLAVNLTVVQELEDARDTATELSAGWVRAIGLASEDGVQPWRLGLEAVEDFEAHDLRAGPLVNLGASRRLHFLASYLFALDDRGDGNFDELAFFVEIEL
jgi:hypothetical protein